MEKNKFFKELYREKWLLILSFVLIYIPSLLFRIFERSEYLKYQYNSTAYTDYTFVILFTLLTACILPLVLFRFLNNKEQIDFHHSLPLNRQELFFSKYMKGIVYFTLPYFATNITTLLMDNFYFPDAQILTLGFVLFLVKFWLMICLSYTLFVIGYLLCGMSIYGFLCGIFLNVTPYIWLQQMDVISSNMFGTLPKYSLSDHIDFLLFYDFNREGAYLSNFSYFLVIVVLLILLILLYSLCVRLYKARKSENTSVPIAIEKAVLLLKVLSVYMVTFVFIITTIDYYNGNKSTNIWFNLFISIILLLALTLVCEVLICQGVRKLKLKNFCVTSSISLVLLTLTFVSANYGIYQYTYTKIPYNDINSIEITGLVNADIEEIDAIEKINSDNYLGTSYKYIVTQDEDIEKTMDLINELAKVNSKKEYKKGFPDRNADLVTVNDYTDDFENINFDIIMSKRWYYYDVYIRKSDEYSMSLYNELLLLSSDKNYYETAANLFEHASTVTMQDYRYNTNDYGDTEIKYYDCKSNPYPSSPRDIDNDFVTTAQATFDELSKLDVSEFDKIPLTTVSYHLENIFFNNYFPITTDAGDLLNYFEIPKQQYVVYDILGSENSAAIIEEVTDSTRQISYFDQALQNRNNAADALFSIENATQLSNFNTDDLLNNDVQAKIYTRLITKEAIEKYDLKLIQAMESKEWYFGIVEVQND